MRKIEYLSPSSISVFYNDAELFYQQYLSDNRLPRDPQTDPMAVGSSFDAYAKSYLHEALFGKGTDPKFDFDALFTAQVQEHCRDQALIAGRYLFAKYKEFGCIADLMLELNQAVSTPKFEMEVKGVVDGHREGVTSNIKGVVLLGKPDLAYINKYGAQVVFDWKVNGYYSKYPKSPMAGYIRVRGGKKAEAHKNASLMMHKGCLINANAYLEDFDESWAVQLAIYSWLLGSEIGEDFIAAIDQLCCSPVLGAIVPEIKVAEHRMRVHRDFQFKTFAKAQQLWDIVHSEHIFRELSLEDSKSRCLTLDGNAVYAETVFPDMTRIR